MKVSALASVGIGVSLATSAMAQTSGPITPETRTVITPIAPPATSVTQVGPGVFVVTPVPGLATATRIKVQKFSDYDLNKDGVYNSMEFAQALYFVATSDPVAGNPALPRDDKFIHRGAPQTMDPQYGIALLNATSDDFMMVDKNHDGRVNPEEMAAMGLM